jgi:DNA helicase-2/ATP-dependent DNA helicase PcrA
MTVLEISAPALLRDEKHLCAVLQTAFSPDQMAAITAPLEPGLIVAGAGSGKTTVMCARVVWLVGRGLVRPDQVLGLTFSRKAAAELATRVRGALHQLLPAPRPVDQAAGTRLVIADSRSVQSGQSEDSGEPTVSTYHAYAGGLITEHGLRLGFEPDLRVVSDATRYQLAARVVGAAAGLQTSLSGHLPTVVQYLLDLDAQLQDHLVRPEQVRAHARVLRAQLAGEKQLKDVVRVVDTTRSRDDLLGLVAAYREAKADLGIAEFADQMARGARLAIECPEVGQAERERFRVVLLDEYQDTSVSQRRMLQGLFSGPGGAGHPVTAVGDPCQAIYGWRGASADNIDAFGAHFPRADGREARRHQLLVNRRSTPEVLALANTLAGPLYDAHPAAEPLTAPPAAAPGAVRATLHATVADEVEWVADEVRRLHARHTEADSRAGGPDSAWSDIAVLVRDRNEVAELARALRRRHVPVEVVGLSGLLSQPEVADVLATLRVVHELTANADLLRLLTGPRWRIGVRDLALLGERAHDLVDADRGGPSGLRDRLDLAVRGSDPTDVVALADALSDPGDKPYSADARRRFGLLAAELDSLRRHAGEPLVELVRRTVDALGLEVELAATPGPDSEQARDNLALFVDAVAEFAGAEVGASLPGLLAYLDAELQFAKGMSVAEPALTNAVTLLTVHSAKGLEWRSVLVPFCSARSFPSSQPRARWQWVASEVPWPLRGDAPALPALDTWTTAGIDAFKRDCQQVDLLEERRLVYVAVTRARSEVVLSGHWWGRTQERSRGPSLFLDETRQHLQSVGAISDDDPWSAEEPAGDEANPMVVGRAPVGFPGALDADLLGRRRRVAEVVTEAMSGNGSPGAGRGHDGVGISRVGPADRERLARLGELDRELDALLAEARAPRADEVPVRLPATVSATLLARLRDDPGSVARDLVRPMPRRPSAAARFGVRFHAWVERQAGQPALLDPNEIPGRGESDIDDDAELADLIERFRRGPYGERVPHAVEAPFQLVLAGQVVAGRIDAVYRQPDGSYQVVDWKTGRGEAPDPLQLAVYRLAWSELAGIPLDQVSAVFCHVRTGRVVEPPDLPGRAGLEAVLLAG